MSRGPLITPSNGRRGCNWNGSANRTKEASLTPQLRFRIALSSCHRPDGSRLLFAVHGDGLRHSVYLGLRSMDAMIDSADLTVPAKAFIEANWPATRLATCPEKDGPVAVIKSALREYQGRYALTGVPSFLDREKRRHPQSLDLLIDGLRGRHFLYLVIADPLSLSEQGTILVQARDLIGALHALSQATVTRTRSDTQGVSRATSSSMGETLGHTATVGESRSRMTKGDWLRIGAFLGFGLTPLFPSIALGAGLAGILATIMPQKRNSSTSTAETSSRTVTTGVTETTTESITRGVAIAQEYINAHVQALEVQLRQVIERIDGQQVWDVGAYLFTEFQDQAQDACSQLAALLNGTRHRGEEPIRFQDLSMFWKDKAYNDIVVNRKPLFELISEGTGARLEHPLGQAFEGLSTPLNTEELSLLVSLPRREIPGVKVRPYAAFALNGANVSGAAITLGEILRGDEPIGAKMRVSLNSFTKNALVTGSTGSGKSVTCRAILSQILAANVPFLVIEPAKSEYEDWARSINARLPPDSPNRIRIYKPGAEPKCHADDQCELRLNLFHVLTPHLAIPHIERIKALLTMSLPMQESLPLLLEGVLYELYARNGWFADGRGKKWQPTTPSIAGLLLGRNRPAAIQGRQRSTVYWESLRPQGKFLDEFVRSQGYDARVTANLTGALKTRFESLRVGWKKNVFDGTFTTPFEHLFDKPAIVNLSLLGDDFSRSLATGLLMTFLHEYRQVGHDSRGRVSGTALRHLVVLEEAHCLLEPVRHVAAESMDPKGMVSRMFADLLSEMRSLGSGFHGGRSVPDAAYSGRH